MPSWLHHGSHPRSDGHAALLSCCLTVNHAPVRFVFGRPPYAGYRRLQFASVVRWESEDALARGERTHAGTVRTFHQGDATVSKPVEINGNHPGKRAFG